jgi:hypothetical protein
VVTEVLTVKGAFCISRRKLGVCYINIWEKREKEEGRGRGSAKALGYPESSANSKEASQCARGE